MANGDNTGLTDDGALLVDDDQDFENGLEDLADDEELDEAGVSAEDVDDDEDEEEPLSPEEELSLLEEEGEIAADYLEALLDIANFDGDIEIDVHNHRAMVDILGEDAQVEKDLQRLVGVEGQTLEALQELTRLAVQTQTGDRSRLMLDIAGFRQKRRQELEAVAREAILRVQNTGKAVKLDPMNPFERKVCHDQVAVAGLVSDSEGVEPHRRVVIYPADVEEA